MFINGDTIELDLAAGVNLKDLSLCIEKMANLSERSGANQLLFKCSNNNDLSSIKKLVNYQAIVSNLIFKFGTVDDDNNIAELVSLYFTKECFETMIVNDGESVMPAMTTFQPNLILLDLMLPGSDGFEICKAIREAKDREFEYATYKFRVIDKQGRE